MIFSKLFWAFTKLVVFTVCLLPLTFLVIDTFYDRLGANPIEMLHHRLGDWALRFLCIGLALTPLKKITGQSWPNRFRRMIGLFAFFYASLHMLVFIGLDLSFSWVLFVDEVPQSPYILMGLLTYMLMLPLALTSTKNWQKRLRKSWKKLHRLVYLAAVSAVIHYFWLVKEDYRDPLFYALLVMLLLAFRVAAWVKKSIRRSAMPFSFRD